MTSLDERIAAMEGRVLNARSVEASRSFHNQLDRLIAQKKSMHDTDEARLARALTANWRLIRREEPPTPLEVARAVLASLKRKP